LIESATPAKIEEIAKAIKESIRAKKKLGR
jgi:hypothetical protein